MFLWRAPLRSIHRISYIRSRPLRGSGPRQGSSAAISSHCWSISCSCTGSFKIVLKVDWRRDKVFIRGLPSSTDKHKLTQAFSWQRKVLKVPLVQEAVDCQGPKISQLHNHITFDVTLPGLRHYCTVHEPLQLTPRINYYNRYGFDQCLVGFKITNT